jgi:PST family polysaccharide transporter
MPEVLETKATCEPPVEASVPEIAVGRSGHRRLLDNIVSLYAVQGLNSVLPLFVLPYLVRTLGVEHYGLLAFAQSFAQYFTIATDYGFNFSATRQIAKTRNDEPVISRLFSAVLAVKVLLMIGGILVLAAVLMLSSRFRENWILYSLAYVSVLGNVLFPMWFFQGMERMRYVSVVTAISKLLSAVAIFVFVHSPEDLLIAVAVQSAGMLVAGMLGLGVAIRDLKVCIRVPSVHELSIVARDGWHLFISTAAITLYTNTNVFMVGLLAGNIQAGYFSAAEKMIRAMQGLITPVMQAMFPHISSLFSDSREMALQFVRKMLKTVSALMFVASLAMLILAPLWSFCVLAKRRSEWCRSSGGLLSCLS